MTSLCDVIVDVLRWATLRCVRAHGHKGQCSVQWDMMGR